MNRAMRNALPPMKLEPLSGLGPVQALWHKTKGTCIGSCNFCNTNMDDYDKVLEISGCHTRVRLCEKCLESVKKQSASSD
jgi:hypothetical protein